MSLLFRIYRLINILSLDVVAGAVVNALFFAEVFDVTLRGNGVVALALSVWIIYTADHLWDAKKILKVASSRRHAFHQKHFILLMAALVVATIVNSFMIFYIRPAVFRWGIVLLALIAVYIFVQYRFHFMKEIFVACLYVMGVLLPALAVTNVEITWFHGAMVVELLLICLLNLYIFSWFDAGPDARDKLGSFVTRFGKYRTAQLIKTLFFLVIAGGTVVLVMSNFQPTAYFPLFMGTVLYVIFAYPDFFARGEYYRLLGDAIFLFPLLYLL
jgi:hypothetical protein